MRELRLDFRLQLVPPKTVLSFLSGPEDLEIADRRPGFLFGGCSGVIPAPQPATCKKSLPKASRPARADSALRALSGVLYGLFRITLYQRATKLPYL